MRNDEPGPLDRLLDGALASYSSAPPLGGLEPRVVERVRAVAAARRRLWHGGIALGGMAVAAAVSIAVIWMAPRESRSVNRAAVAVPALPVAKPNQAPARGHSPRVRRRRVFPTPTPITEQERALLALATPEAGAAWLDLQHRSSGPIQFAQIKIEPLDTEGSNKERYAK